ncbi:MAG: sugar ABC transporter substrate-binding protein [Lachnospiraceae bacterium]|nr:sugar ABC transporter substrate-binding protein [Lachnospiraceae bacterium]
MMKKTIRLAAMILAAVMTMAALAGCGGGSSSSSGSADSGAAAKIGFVNEANTDVFDNTRMTALQTLADEVGGYNIEYSDANLDIQKQIDQANTFLSKNVDILMLVPCDSDGIIPAIQNANNKGTPTICFGIKANGGDFIFVGSNSYDAGHMQGELMAEMLPENAKVCYLAGTAGLEHSILRRQGFQEALAEAGRDDIEIIEDQDAQYTKAKAMEKVDAWVQKYADGKGGVTFDAVVAANDQMALGAVESLKGANILKGNNEILISGIDGTPDGVAAVANGYMVQTVLQDAAGQAKAGLEAVDKIMAGEQIPGNEIMVPFVNITQDNVADFQ